PVGDVLRVLRALHHAVPQFHVTALADRRATHRVENGCLQQDQAERDEQTDPAQPSARARRCSPVRCTQASPLRQHLPTESSAASQGFRRGAANDYESGFWAPQPASSVSTTMLWLV